MKKNIEIGDVFEMYSEAHNMRAYLQCIEIPKDKINQIELIRIYFYFDIATLEINQLQNLDFFYIRFPLKAAIRKKVVKKIGNTPIPENFELPKFFRTINLNGDGWQIVDSDSLKRQNLERLTDEHKKLSPWGMMNDTLIFELLNKKWNLENWDLNNMFDN